MKRYLGFILRAFALVTLIAIGLNSCSKDKDDDEKKKTSNSKSMAATIDAFHNGYLNNKENTILIDLRSPQDFAASHIKGAVNKYCDLDDIAKYADNKYEIYDFVTKEDPTHSKFIQMYGEGLGAVGTKVAQTISSMGWGFEKTVILSGNYSDYAKKYPDDIEK